MVQQKVLSTCKHARILALKDLLLCHSETLQSSTRYLCSRHLLKLVICIKDTCQHP